jgi:phytoene dehydrogenase-like protein
VRVAEVVRDPLLAEMLLVAPCFYGSASEDDMSWGDFGVLFRSIHLEGMARPAGGIKALLDLLIGRFEAEGGELRMRNGVARIEVRDGCARAVLLDDGTRLEAEQIFSSAGLVETRALCGLDGAQDEHDIGRLSFVETISVLDRAPHELGYLATITFFNNGPTFRYARPDDFIDATSGVINCPNNYAHKTPLPEGLLRVTAIANHARFAALGEAEYRAAKDRSVERMLDAAAPFAFDPRPYSVERDSFSPTTIERFTGHRGGAIYGTPHKRRDGASGVAALHLIGTDAGQVGIVGALLSGIATANSAVLAPQGGAS